MVDLRFDGSVWCNVDIALRHVETIYKQETEILGLSVIEWYVLRMLYEQEGQKASRLAEALGRALISLVPILDKIQDKGLIDCRQYTRDRRAVRIYLTDKGRALEGDIKASMTRIENKLRRNFTDNDWRGYAAVIANLQVLETKGTN
jgi:DNA-binding MarR family transcriptional regulator